MRHAGTQDIETPRLLLRRLLPEDAPLRQHNSPSHRCAMPAPSEMGPSAKPERFPPCQKAPSLRELARSRATSLKEFPNRKDLF